MWNLKLGENDSFLMLILIELINNFNINNGESIIRIILGVSLVGTEMDWLVQKVNNFIVSKIPVCRSRAELHQSFMGVYWYSVCRVSITPSMHTA